MIEILIIVLGSFVGVFTGLVPGIHPNTVVFTSLPVYFSAEIGLLPYLCFIAGLSVCHTFHDFLPSIFLGAPEADTALASIPGVEMAENGKGIEAFYYTVMGGTVAILTLVFLTPFLLIFLEAIYGILEPYMALILGFFLFVLVFDSENRFASITLMALSGSLGLIAFSMPINSQNVLMPVFAGMFALPTFLTSFAVGEVKQQESPKINNDICARGGVLGAIAGLLTGVFPGLTGSAATSFFTPLMKEKKKEFLSALGAVNTSDALVSFLSLYILEKARSGPAVALKAAADFSSPQLIFLLGASVFATAVSIVLALNTPRKFLYILENYSFRKALLAALVVIFGSTVFLTGPIGILVLFTSACIGYAGALKSERRVLISVLMVPAIVMFSNGLII